MSDGDTYIRPGGNPQIRVAPGPHPLAVKIAKNLNLAGLLYARGPIATEVAIDSVACIIDQHIPLREIREYLKWCGKCICKQHKILHGPKATCQRCRLLAQLDPK